MFKDGIKGKLVILVGLAVGAIGSANAVPMTWTYSGTCSWGDCSEAPSITGSLTADPSLYGSDTQINEYALFGDLVHYSFTIGDYSFSGSSGFGTYLLDSLGNITGGSMTFNNIFALEFLGVGHTSWAVADFADWRSFGGQGSYTTTRVPEPTTLGLFGIALLGAGLSARRKKTIK